MSKKVTNKQVFVQGVVAMSILPVAWVTWRILSGVWSMLAGIPPESIVWFAQ